MIHDTRMDHRVVKVPLHVHRDRCGGTLYVTDFAQSGRFYWS